MLYQEEKEEGAEVEIEMNEDELAFLQGQSRYSSSMDMSLVIIFYKDKIVNLNTR